MRPLLTALPLSRRTVLSGTGAWLAGAAWPAAQASPADQTVDAIAAKSAWPATGNSPNARQLVR